MADKEEQNPLNVSDDDFLTMAPPVVDTAGDEAVKEEPAVEEQEAEKQDEVQEEDQDASNKDEKEAEADPKEDEDEKSDSELEEEPKAEDELKPDEGGKSVKADPKKVEDPKEPKKDPKEKEQPVTETVNYEAAYKQIMAPFKANGKTIELKSPEEAIALMQMGANYTRKMQDIQPHRKVLMMLESNGLLDESKLSYLIDIDKGNSEAIKKLIKDKNIDPMEIDTSVEPAYLGGNHKVTDEEVKFRTNLEELNSSDFGKETLGIINDKWDQASKEMLWQSPEVMTVIHQQRENGIYDQIVAELDRQRMLGKIPADTPFLHAYKSVGDYLVQNNALKPKEISKENPLVKSEPKTPVATRAAAPKANVDNGDKVSAASPTRSTPRTAKALVNPLTMSDDDFMKQFSNRL